MQEQGKSRKEKQCMMPNNIGSTYMQQDACLVGFFDIMLRVLDAWHFQKGQSRSEWDEEIMKVKLMTVIPVQVQHSTYNAIYVRAYLF